MDWALKKSAAKKGRRSNQQQNLTTQQTTLLSPQTSINSSQITASTSPTNLASSSMSSQLLNEKEDSMGIDLDVSIEHDQTLKTPPKKITAGWADKSSGKNKSKNLFEDERFNTTVVATTATVENREEDNIPVIPDLDDIQDELLMNEIVEPPSVTVNRVVTLKELDSDLLKQSAFSTLEDVDLTILTKHLQQQEMLDEPDEVWEWDQLFTEVSAEIHMETSATNKNHKAEETIQTQYLS